MVAPKAIRAVLVLRGPGGEPPSTLWLSSGLSLFHGVAVPLHTDGSWARPDAAALDSSLAPPRVPLVRLAPGVPWPHTSLGLLEEALLAPRALRVGGAPLLLLEPEGAAVEPSELSQASSRPRLLRLPEPGAGGWAPSAPASIATSAAEQVRFAASLGRAVDALGARDAVDERLLWVAEPPAALGSAGWLATLELLRAGLQDAAAVAPAALALVAERSEALAGELRHTLDAQRRALSAFREELRRTTAALEQREAELQRLRREPGFWLAEALRERVVERPRLHARLRAAVETARRWRRP